MKFDEENLACCAGAMVGILVGGLAAIMGGASTCKEAEACSAPERCMVSLHDAGAALNRCSEGTLQCIQQLEETEAMLERAIEELQARP